MAKIAIIIAPRGFRDEEFKIPYEILKEKNEVEVFSTEKGTAKGMLGMEWKVDKDLNELNVEKFDAILFTGGSGTRIVRKDERAIEIVKKAYEKNKIVGAICWAPTILAKAGILKGKKATVWLGFDPEYKMRTDEVLEKFGAIFENKNVVIDGNIITANGPNAAREYALKILQML